MISEIPFDLAIHDRLWYLGAQNIFFTLTAGLFVIYCMESRGPLGRWRGEIALTTALLAEFLRFDYGMAGVGVIVVFYWCGKDSRAELPTSADSAVKLSYFSLRQEYRGGHNKCSYIYTLPWHETAVCTTGAHPYKYVQRRARKMEFEIRVLHVLSGAFAHHMVYMDYMEKITVDYWL